MGCTLCNYIKVIPIKGSVLTILDYGNPTMFRTLPLIGITFTSSACEQQGGSCMCLTTEYIHNIMTSEQEVDNVIPNLGMVIGETITPKEL